MVIYLVILCESLNGSVTSHFFFYKVPTSFSTNVTPFSYHCSTTGAIWDLSSYVQFVMTSWYCLSCAGFFVIVNSWLLNPFVTGVVRLQNSGSMSAILFFGGLLYKGQETEEWLSTLLWNLEWWAQQDNPSHEFFQRLYLHKGYYPCHHWYVRCINP